MKAIQYFGLVLSFKLHPVRLLSMWIFTVIITTKCQRVTNHSFEITNISHAPHIESKAYI